MRSEGTVLVSAFLGIVWWVVVAVAVAAAAATEFSPPPPPNSASTLRAEHQGYRVTAVNEFADGSGFVAALELIKPSETYGADIKQLSMVVRNEEDELLHVHISDSLNPRWEVPQQLIQRPVPLSLLHVNKDQNTLLQLHRNLNSQVPESQGELDSTSSDRLLEFSYTSAPFGFSITRISTGEVLFNSTPVAASSSSDDDDHHGVIDDIVQSFSFNSMVFKDQYLEISTQMPKTTSLFGLGESTKSKLQITRGRTYTLWATDIGADNVNIDLYGAFPFYMDVRQGGAGASHGVLLLNSNGMDVDVNEDFLTYHIIGGVLDFYFFAGPSPLAVVDQYTKLIGRPAPMPFWSFGFHQCKWGYKNIDDLRYVVENYRKANIPLETIWNDIDYMDAYKDFTLDPVSYAEPALRAFVDELHANGQHYILILDPGISVIDQNYSTLQRGLRADIFLKNEFGNNYLAQVWPGPVYFPDFLHPKAQSWWTTEIAEFFKKVPFDGLWIDMNEASNFCSGSDCSFDATAGVPSFDGGCFLHCTTGSTRFDDPPYKIDRMGECSEIGERSIAMTVKHYTGALEYDAHNLYGLSESIVTNKALKDVTKKRPFILSRSTFVGSGAHAAHWTGDNKATWEDLEYSVASVLNSGIFGVPMVGADICGFAGNTTEELCNRWMQLGAFYPFARSHAEILSNPQEPYLWESVAISSRKALGLRYRLLPYMYTLMYEAHTQGFPIARPLFFGFPQDSMTLTVSHQFLLGNGILVSPVLSPGQTSVNAYLPEGVWYNMFDFSKVTSQGAYHMLPAAADEINVHVHEGSVVPMQGSALTTAEVRNSPFTLLVALGKDFLTRAHGTLFLDSGDDLEMVLQNGKSTLVTYFVEASTGSGHMTASVIYGSYALQQGWQLHTLQILGIKLMPTKISINGEPVSLSAKAIFHPAKLFLEIHGLDLPVGKEFELTWETSSADILP